MQNKSGCPDISGRFIEASEDRVGGFSLSDMLVEPNRQPGLRTVVIEQWRDKLVVDAVGPGRESARREYSVEAGNFTCDGGWVVVQLPPGFSFAAGGMGFMVGVESTRVGLVTTGEALIARLEVKVGALVTIVPVWDHSIHWRRLYREKNAH